MIEGGSLASVGLSKNANARGEFGNNFGSAVGGTVVDDKNFAMGCRIILRQSAGDRFFDEALVIVGVNQDADKGFYHSGITENAWELRSLARKIP